MLPLCPLNFLVKVILSEASSLMWWWMTRGCYNLVTSDLPASIFLHRSDFVGWMGYPECARYCALIVWHDLWPEPKIILTFHLRIQKIGRLPNRVPILDNNIDLQWSQWISVDLQSVIHISVVVLTTEPTNFDRGKLWSDKKWSRLFTSNTTLPFQQPNVLRGLRISRSMIFNNGSMKWSFQGGIFTSVANILPSELTDISLVTKSRQL